MKIQPLFLIFVALTARAEPPLTLAEKALVKQYRAEARVVHQQKGIAEASTIKRFGRNVNGDESDAYRHYLWASLLVKELGKDMANRFLQAHEVGSANSTEEEKMDRANNELAVREAQALEQKKSLTLEQIEISALAALKEKRLMVIRSVGMPSP